MGPEGSLVTERLARGCRAFGVWLGDELAGYGWLSTKPEWIGELELEISPGRAEGYIWNCATVPHLRRRGVLRTLLAGITARTRHDGMQRLWIGSVAVPAEKAFGPSGFTPALVFRSIALGGLHLMRSGPAPGANESLVAHAYQVLDTRTGLRLQRSRPRRH